MSIQTNMCFCPDCSYQYVPVRTSTCQYVLNIEHYLHVPFQELFTAAGHL